MITAKNYAAQAEKSLRFLAESVSKQDSATLYGYADEIKKAQHFSMPDGGLVFDDGRKGIEGKEIRLPFPIITIEYFCSLSEEKNKTAKYDEVFTPKRMILVREFPMSQLSEIFSDFVSEEVINCNSFKESSHFFAVSQMAQIFSYLAIFPF